MEMQAHISQIRTQNIELKRNNLQKVKNKIKIGVKDLKKNMSWQKIVCAILNAMIIWTNQAEIKT